jgi:hypothetical protein
MLLLAVWLILTGVLPFLNVGVPGIVMSLLALAAGVLILLGR